MQRNISKHYDILEIICIKTIYVSDIHKCVCTYVVMVMIQQQKPYMYVTNVGIQKDDLPKLYKNYISICYVAV